VRRLVPVVLAFAFLPAGAGAQSDGGTIWAFVSVADGTRVAVVNVAGERVVGSVSVPPGSREVAATLDGRRVLAVSPSSRTVTQFDGVARTVTRTFHGFGRPTAIVLAPAGSIGFTHSRFAYVTDEARGLLDVLDLTRGVVAARVDVGPRPTRVVLVNGHLWVAHRESTRLTVLDASTAAHPVVVDHANAGGPVSDLIGSGDELSIVVSYRNSRLLGRIGSVSARLVERRSSGTIVRQIALDPLRRLWVVPARGGRATILSLRLRRLGHVTVPASPTALVSVGGFMALAGRGQLVLIAVGTPSRRAIPVGAGTGGVAFAIR